jgi:hypothetical protein
MSKVQTVSTGSATHAGQSCRRHAPPDKLSSRRPVQLANVRNCPATAERGRLSDVSCCNMVGPHVLPARYLGLRNVKRSRAVKGASSRNGTRSVSRARRETGSACGHTRYLVHKLFAQWSRRAVTCEHVAYLASNTPCMCAKAHVLMHDPGLMQASQPTSRPSGS